MEGKFEWDEAKAESNFRKHGVEMDEGATVFDDPNVIYLDDNAHSEEEVREIALGYSDQNRLLCVVYTERGIKTRLISVCQATHYERREYEQYNTR